MALALDLEPDCFTKNNEKMVIEPGNGSTLHFLNYPIVEEINLPFAKLQEHEDFGSITFIYQDNESGLEVESPEGKWTEVQPSESSLVLLVGKLMETWTAGRYKATNHRVMPKEWKMWKPRQSFAFFIDPDDDFEVKPLFEPVGDKKYEATKARDFVKKEYEKF